MCLFFLREQEKYFSSPLPASFILGCLLQTIALGHVAFDLLENEQCFELSVCFICRLSLVR